MRLSEIKGEAALDAAADLIDPITEIAKDRILVGLIRLKNYPEAIKLSIRSHKKTVIKILAILNQQDADTYEPSLIDLPKMLIDLLNDPMLADLLQSQAQTTEETSSVSAMENTGASEN